MIKLLKHSRNTVEMEKKSSRNVTAVELQQKFSSYRNPGVAEMQEKQQQKHSSSRNAAVA